MFGFNIVSSAMPYYVTVLLGKPADFGGRIMAVALGVAAVSFPFVNWLATRFSKKRVIMAGGLSLAVVMALTPVLRDVNIAFVVFGLSGLPIAVLLSVPNAILSDICEANAQRTGQRREAMFFGTQGLFQKLNLGLSTALLAGLLEAFGNSVEQPGGVMWSGPMASVALVLSGVCFAFYPEKDVAEAQLRVVNPRA
jgi:GPH family glycoside/pentoside/hexuronide:cation symporter